MRLNFPSMLMCPASDSQGPMSDEKSEFANVTEQLHVGHSIRERRLDKYLHGRFSNLSRNFIQNAIKQGAVKVNGKIAKQSLKLSPGDIIDFTPPEPPGKDILPEDIPLDIIYEDDCLIVLNKQANMIVHPARGNTHGTLVNALAFYSDKLSSGLGHFRPGIIHRLDKNTTGVMVVTKDQTSQWKIARQFQHRQIKKSYLAIVHGTADGMVPVSLARAFSKALTDAGIDHIYEEHSGGHDFVADKSLQFMSDHLSDKLVEDDPLEEISSVSSSGKLTVTWGVIKGH